MFIYILASSKNGTLYVGVTSDLARRVYEHKHGLFEGFSKKHSVNKLVYWEQWSSMVEAISREKQLKAGSRQKKLRLIEGLNPEWEDLSAEWGWSSDEEDEGCER